MIDGPMTWVLKKEDEDAGSSGGIGFRQEPFGSSTVVGGKAE